MEKVDAVKPSFLDFPHSIDNPAWLGGMRPNGPMLFSPAEAGRPSPPYVRRAGKTSYHEGPGRRVSFPGLRPGQAASCWAA